MSWPPLRGKQSLCTVCMQVFRTSLPLLRSISAPPSRPRRREAHGWRLGDELGAELVGRAGGQPDDGAAGDDVDAANEASTDDDEETRGGASICLGRRRWSRQPASDAAVDRFVLGSTSTNSPTARMRPSIPSGRTTTKVSSFWAGAAFTVLGISSSSGDRKRVGGPAAGREEGNALDPRRRGLRRRQGERPAPRSTGPERAPKGSAYPEF